MTETPRPWDRLDNETAKAFDAFRAYLSLGARRSVREAARQHHATATSTGEISGRQRTTVRTWIGWSSRHGWVRRADSRDAWLVRVSDDQIAVNVRKCLEAITERALKLLEEGDSHDFLRAARALALIFPPVQRSEEVTERFEDLSDLPDSAIEAMKKIRDEARENANADEPLH